MTFNGKFEIKGNWKIYFSANYPRDKSKSL